MSRPGNDFGPLFGEDFGDSVSYGFDQVSDSAAERAPARAPHTYGVFELNRAIENALKRTFSQQIWIRGEIQGLSRSRPNARHRYFELVEKKAGQDQVAAKVPVALLDWNRAAIDQDCAQAPGFVLEDNIEVRIRAKVGYYPPYGKLQLEMMGIDPTFTLGQMAASRERVLRGLAQAGLLERNAQQPFAAAPRRVGLITSLGSAAYNDFVQELQRHPYSFSVKAIDARVSGHDTERTVVRALRAFAQHPPDVVVLIRGGGSRSDLSAFDSEMIARGIATMPVPVITGIGHETDRSVADEVAALSLKTPTACAAELVRRMAAAVETVENAWAEIVEGTHAAQVRCDEALLASARQIAAATRTTLVGQQAHLRSASRHLRQEARHGVTREVRSLGSSSRRLRDVTRSHLAASDSHLQEFRRRLSPERTKHLWRRHRSELEHMKSRLLEPLRHRFELHQKMFDAHEAQVRALDPRRALQRGYSLTYDAQGKLVRNAQDCPPGAQIVTHLADARVVSQVESVEPQPPTKEPS